MTRLRPRIALLFSFTLSLTLAPSASPAPPPNPGPAERCVAAAERGQQERDRAAFVEARASFRACSADECPSLVRRDCVQWLSDVETSVPSVVVGAKDARGNDLLDARILVDGRSYKEEIDAGRAIALDPGPHVFHFDHPPDAPVELTLVLRTGERNRPIYGTFGAATPVSSAPTPPPARPVAPARVTHVSPWAYVLGGVAVAGLASFASFGAGGLNEKNQLRAECNDTCSDQQVQPLKVDYITADTSLGLGVVAAAISIWLFTHPSVEARPESAIDTKGARAGALRARTPVVSVAPTRGGASVSFVASF